MMERRGPACLAIGAILLGQALSVASGREAWPFCAYQMFSGLREDDSLVRLRLFGVPAGRPAEEIPLVGGDQIAPFDSARMNRALGRLRKREDGGASLHEAVRDCGLRYEKRRGEGAHAGPPLEAIRLYEVRWRIDLENPDPERTESRTRLLEVRLDAV